MCSSDLILGDCILKLLEARSKRACWNLLHGQQGEDLAELEKEVAEAGAKYADFIEQHRRKCDSVKFRSMIDGWTAALRELQEKVRSGGLLSVLFALPDGFGAERLRILVNGDEIASGVFKGAGTFFQTFFFLPAATAVKEVRIEGCGFAGQGVAYVSARTAKGTFVPAGIAGCSGLVEHPEYALTPNVNYAWLGSRDVIGCFKDRTLAEAVHSICLTMKKEK